jgi:hypothetical protein
MLWQIVTAANLAIAVAYFAISAIIFRGLRASGQLWSNKLATATGLIFFTCAVHHGGHALHMLVPSLGIHDQHALNMRNSWNWENAGWDVFGAAVAFWYLSLRGSYASVLRGAQMFEDFQVRERQALEINDNIVQGLAVAKMALERGSDADTREAIEDTLRRSQALITDLLAGDRTQDKFGPGDLRRSDPADLALPSPTLPPAP